MKTKEMSFQHNQSMAKTHTGAHTSHSLIILAQDLNLFTVDETHKIILEISILYVGKEKSLKRIKMASKIPFTNSDFAFQRAMRTDLLDTK